MQWICDKCGYIYDGEDFEKEPEDYLCPLCDHGKEEFHYRNLEEEVLLAANEYHSK